VASRRGFRSINGVKHDLWRAVDHEGDVLESFVTKRRDKKAGCQANTLITEIIYAYQMVESS
jgi:transposase-like protein